MRWKCIFWNSKSAGKNYYIEFQIRWKHGAISLKKKIENYNFIMLLVFHYEIQRIIDLSSKDLPSKVTDLSNDLRYLQVWLEELERYRHNFVEKETNSVTKNSPSTTNFLQLVRGRWNVILIKFTRINVYNILRACLK